MRTAEVRQAGLLELVRDLISFAYRQFTAQHHQGVNT